MPRFLIAGALAAMAVAGCATTDAVPPVAPVLDACPPSATAALEPRPAGVTLTDTEQRGMDDAGIRVLGPDRFGERELSEAQKDARTRRLEGRIEQTRTWCVERQPRPG